MPIGIGPVAYHGLNVAPNDTLLTASPTWERLDTQLRLAEVSIDRGRQDVFDKTDTGTVTAIFNDPNGVLDPTNPSSPYFGDELISKPMAFSVRNPVTGDWWPRIRTAVDDYGYDLHPSQKTGQTAIVGVDAMDYFANLGMEPGPPGNPRFGDPPPPGGGEGFIFYEDTEGTVQDRIIQILQDAGWPSALWSVFTGNVQVQETTYADGDSVLSALQDAADAEFPDIANCFVDKYGFFCFHGRFARFTPDSVAASATHWDFNRWKAGDGAAVAIDPTRAQIRPPFGFTRGRKMVRNVATAYPMGIRLTDKPGQVLEDQPSIDTFGEKPWKAENLIVLHGTTTGFPANDECKLYAQHAIDNYKTPKNRIEQITFKSLEVTGARAAALWALVTRADISDIVNIEIDHPGGGGFSNSDHFIEGFSERWVPLHNDLDTGYPLVEMTLNLSPASYWGTNQFPSALAAREFISQAGSTSKIASQAYAAMLAGRQTYGGILA